MASLALLWNLPTSPAEFAEWTFNHQAAHQDINRFVGLKFAPNGSPGTGLTLPSYVLDPLNPDDPNMVLTWAYQHSIMHYNQDLILGIQGYDLTELDWRDTDIMQQWLAQHASEHQQAAQILEIP
jgi:hypothetical protein